MLLYGLTAKEFVVYYLVGIAGIMVRFMINLQEGIMRDRATPFHFEWRYFVKGATRLVVSLAIMAVVVARFKEFSHLLVNIELPAPTRYANGLEPVAGITAGSAFGLGMAIDEVVKRFVHTGHAVIKKRTNGHAVAPDN